MSAFQKLQGVKGIFTVHFKIQELSEVFLSGRAALDLIPEIPPTRVCLSLYSLVSVQMSPPHSYVACSGPEGKGELCHQLT